MKRSPGSQGARAAPEHGSTAPAPGWRAQALLLALGGLSLAIAALLYLCDRPVAHAQLLPAFGAPHVQHLFGAAGPWLPSFLHPLAFSLFSAVLLRPGWGYGACAFWGGLNGAFEIGQHPLVRDPLVDLLRQLAGQGPLARAFQNYFLRGTFDAADLAAAALGAGAAALALRQIHHARETRHGPPPHHR